MKLREFYENNGVDYDVFLGRLMGKESLLEKYINIFLGDSTFTELTNAVAQKDFEQVGKTAHTLKGIALNLDFKKLGGLCAELINSVHMNDVQAIEGQFDCLKLEYEYIISALQQ